MDRGFSCVLSESGDGFQFVEKARWTKQSLKALSMEKCGLLLLEDQRIGLYVSYASDREDGTKGMWCIDRLVSDRIEGLAPGASEPEQVLIPSLCPPLPEGWVVAGVKDPFFLTDAQGRFFFDQRYHMIISFAKARKEAPVCEPLAAPGDIHAEGDCYHSGQILSGTAYLTSEDGLHFEWQGEILTPLSHTWCAYAARITTLRPLQGRWIGFFDGARSVEENYHERAGLIMGPGLSSLQVLSSDGPSVCPAFSNTEPGGGWGGVRYITALSHLGRDLLYYEFTRDDGSHDLRVAEARWR
jgi:hypothetical protein